MLSFELRLNRREKLQGISKIDDVQQSNLLQTFDPFLEPAQFFFLLTNDPLIDELQCRQRHPPLVHLVQPLVALDDAHKTIQDGPLVRICFLVHFRN